MTTKSTVFSHLRKATLPKQHQSFTSKHNANMPLVVPGITSNIEGDKTEQWSNKLVGKKLGESSDATTFARAELPKETRVIEKGTIVTKDFREDRLNVHLKEDGTVSHVHHG